MVLNPVSDCSMEAYGVQCVPQLPHPHQKLVIHGSEVTVDFFCSACEWVIQYSYILYSFSTSWRGYVRDSIDLFDTHSTVSHGISITESEDRVSLLIEAEDDS